ncbi:G1 family glutamic endopeptidase [Kitasatospora aburaviensis]
MPGRRHLVLATAVARTVVLGGVPDAPAAPRRPAAPPGPGSPEIGPSAPLGGLQGFLRAGVPEVTRVSGNWAGYLVSGEPGSFTVVEARWTQPAADCADAPYDTIAAVWVGLDGTDGGKGTVQQTGTSSECVEDERVYNAWYEMWPGVAVEYNDPVEPGDRLWARVEYIGNDTYELFLRNITKKWTEITYAKPRAGPTPSEPLPR